MACQSPDGRKHPLGLYNCDQLCVGPSLHTICHRGSRKTIYQILPLVSVFEVVVYCCFLCYRRQCRSRIGHPLRNEVPGPFLRRLTAIPSMMRHKGEYGNQTNIGGHTDLSRTERVRGIIYSLGDAHFSSHSALSCPSLHSDAKSPTARTQIIRRYHVPPPPSCQNKTIAKSQLDRCGIPQISVARTSELDQISPPNIRCPHFTPLFLFFLG